MAAFKKIIVFSTILVSIIGTLLHFVYQWSGQNTLVGLFAPINESTWEHMKLLFFPMLIIGCFVWWKVREQLPYIGSSLLAGLLIGTWLIPVLFYTYRGILGYGISAVDITIFFISVIIAFLITYRTACNGRWESVKWLLVILTIIMTIAFFWFTYHPPMLGIFANPTP